MVSCISSIPSGCRTARRLLFFGLFLFFAPLACGGGGGGGETTNTANPTTFTLSGTITPPANAAVDWDVNDVNTTAATSSNDALSSTQPLFNPVGLAGHLSLSSDISDFYSVSLTANQTIAVYEADPDKVNLDVYLYNSSGQLVDSGMGSGTIESLDISADGDYIIEVRIVSLGNQVPVQDQSSNYNLVIGTDLSSAGGSKGMRLSDDFVPGEVLVRFKDDTFKAQGGGSSGNRYQGQALGLTLAGGGPGRVMQMRFDIESDTPTIFKALGMPNENPKSAAPMDDPILKGKQRTLEVIKALRQRGDVQYAEPNYIRKTFAAPDDTYFNLQWHFEQIRLPAAWDITTGSTDVIVAVVDTGVLVNHPDLAGKLTGTGYDFIKDINTSGDGDGIDNNPDDPGDQARADGSSSFHGTHVAGTITAATNNNVGVAGAGWATRVMAIRALGKNGAGTDFDIAQGIYYAAGLPNDSGAVPDIPADIINLSLGGDINSTTLADAVQAALARDVIIVAAAGNESTSQPSYPAAYPGVVSVSAVDYATNLAYYSNFGSTIDVAAPGGDASTDLNGDGYGDGVLSTLGTDSSGSIEMVYGFYQGTSMAAPHISAVVALMKALRPAMTPTDLDAFLAAGDITTNIGSANSFGSGLIHAQKAVLAAQTVSVPTLLSVNPSLLSLGIALSGAPLTAEKIGDTSGSISVTGATTDVPWLVVAPDTVDADGLGTYTVTGSRSGLANGIYNGKITFTSSQNTVEVTVNMQVNTTSGDVDAGYHYVELTDTSTGQVAYRSGVRARGGLYSFLMFNVAPGTYELRAGTDLDSDGRIGDPGEVIGAYLSLDQPQMITVDRNISSLDFISEFNIQISGAATSAQPEPEVLHR